MDLAAWVPDRQKKPGPSGVLCARLSDIGWAHLHGFMFVDQEGIQIDIMNCPTQELRQRSKGWTLGHSRCFFQCQTWSTDEAGPSGQFTMAPS